MRCPVFRATRVCFTGHILLVQIPNPSLKIGINKVLNLLINKMPDGIWFANSFEKMIIVYKSNSISGCSKRLREELIYVKFGKEQENFGGVWQKVIRQGDYSIKNLDLQLGAHICRKL